MTTNDTTARHWLFWRKHFEFRRPEPLPDPFSPEPELADVPASVARSLAIFQLGESGGGSLVGQARRSRLPGIDADYAAALALFVAEEHRHAELLACGVRMLGGRLVRKNWTARLFVFGRRLLGLRLKIMVLLAAEVVGLVYYRLIAAELPPSRLRALLGGIADDEMTHLDFHCAFLRTQTTGWLRTLVFRASWRTLMVAAAIVVMIDHRHALGDLGINRRRVWRLWMNYSRHAEQKAVGARQPGTEPCTAVSDRA